MDICCYEDGQAMLVELSGPLRNNDSLEIKRHLKPWLSGLSKPVIVDLAGIQGAAMPDLLGILSSLRRQANQQGQRLVIRSPGASLMRFLRLHRLDRVFGSSGTPIAHVSDAS